MTTKNNENGEGRKHYRLEVENFLSITKAEIPLEPGVHGFVGQNEQGKTNLLQAFDELLRGGHDVGKIRRGEKKAVIRLAELQGDEVKARVERVQTDGKNALSGKGLPLGETPASFVTRFLDEIAVNPLGFMTRDPVDYIKRHVDAHLESKELPSDLSKEIEIGPATLEKNGFEVCEMVAKALGDARIQVGRDVRREEGLAAELGAGLPSELPRMPETPPGIDEQIERLQAQAALAKDAATQLHAAEVSLAQLKNEKAVLEGKIESLKIQISRAETVVMELRAKPTANDTAVALADLKAKKAAYGEWNTIAQAVEKRDSRAAELRKLKDRHGRLDELFKLFAYELPATLLARCDLGVEGLSFQDGKLVIDGLPLERHSASRRALVCTALAIAIAKRKGHKAICLDGIEIMDREHREQFFRAAEESGLAVFYTRVGEVEHPHERRVVSGNVL